MGLLALPQFSKPDSFQTNGFAQLALGASLSYDRAPAPVSKGLPSLLMHMSYDCMQFVQLLGPADNKLTAGLTSDQTHVFEPLVFVAQRS